MTSGTQASYVITKLNKQKKDNFNCGSIALDNYIKFQASQDMKKNVAMTYAATLMNGADIIGYYTLSSISIDASALPDETIKKLPKYPLLPGILLGRLAIDTAHQGKGIGVLLLIDALASSLNISDQIGINAVIVNAKDKSAANFYIHYGFIKFPSNNLKLFMPINTIKSLKLS
jgi:predicted GNAT family N-acyltransferase